MFCKDCARFIQHYIKGKNRYYKCGCGHCMYLIKGIKTEDTPACNRFVPIENSKK